MQPLPYQDHLDSEAAPVSEILARANPAEMPAMRASLSFLTSAGAELAAALARRDREYDELLAIVNVLPSEWIEAAKTGAPMPDVAGLRAELQLAKDERIDLHGQLVERDRQIQALQDQISQVQLAPPAEEAAASAVDAGIVDAQLAEMRDELEKAALARAEAEDHLRASDAELSDIENRLADLSADLLAALPEDARAELTAAPVDEQLQDSRQRRAMRLGALAAAVSAMIERSKQADLLVESANDRVAAVESDLSAADGARMALEADLAEKMQALEDMQSQVETLHAESEGLTAQIEQLNQQTAALQADLDAALAAKTAAEEQLLATEGELAELNQQIDSVNQQVRAVLPADLLSQLEPAAEEAPSQEEAPTEETVEGDELATRSAAPKLLGLGGLAAGVAAAVDLSNQKSSEAAEAAAQLAALGDEKASLEGAVAELTGQVEELTARSGELQGQLDAAVALNADLEQQKGELDQQLADLRGQADDATVRLQALLSDEDLLALQPEQPDDEAAPEEAEEGGRRALSLAALVGGVAALLSRKDSAAAEQGEQIATLSANLDGIGQEKAALEGVLEQKNQELAGYNDYVLNLQGQVNQLMAEKMAVEADLQLQVEAQSATEAQIADLTAQIEALTAQVADLQAQLDASNAAKAELEQTLRETQAQLEAAQAELAQIGEDTERSLGEKAARLGVAGAGVAAADAIRDRDDELAAANEQVQALQQQVADLSASSAGMAALQDQLAELEGQKVELDAQLAELAGQKAELDTQLGERAAEIEALQARLGELEAAVAAQAEPEAKRSAGLSIPEAAELSEALARLPSIKTHAVSAAIVAGAQPVLSPRIQALTDVHGVGSVFQQRLYNAGIGTYWELASVPDAELEETLQIPALRRSKIDLGQMRAEAYALAQQTDTVGLLWDGDHVDDFESLPGVGKTFEKRLYEAGITTYEQLVATDIPTLQGIVRAPALLEVSYEAWIEQAQQLLSARTASQPAETTE